MLPILLLLLLPPLAHCTILSTPAPLVSSWKLTPDELSAIGGEPKCASMKDPDTLLLLGCTPRVSLADAKLQFKKNEPTWKILAGLDPKQAEEAFVDSVVNDAFGQKATPLSVLAKVVYVCGKLPGCLERTMSKEERIKIAKSLIDSKEQSLEAALALKALAGVSVMVNKKSETESEVVATTLTGEPVKWQLGKNSSPLVTMNGPKLKVTFDPKADAVSQVPVEIELLDGSKRTVVHNLEFEVEVKFSNLVLAVKPTETEIKIGSYAENKLHSIVSLEATQILEVSLMSTAGSKGFCPEQAWFNLQNGIESVIQVPCSCASQTGVCKASFNNNPKLAEQLAYISGLYEFSFVASDAKMKTPTFWKIGKVNITTHGKPPKAHLPLFTNSLLHESDTTRKPLPEIYHQFRQPDRRAPTIFALLFSAAQMGLVFMLLVASLKLGASVTTLLSRPRLLIFAVGLVAVELIYFVYWLGVPGSPNMVDLSMYYLPLLFVTMFFVSRNVLSGSPMGGSMVKPAAAPAAATSGGGKKTASM